MKEPPSGETSVISKFKEIAFDEVSSALGDDVKKLSQEEKDKILDRVIQSDRKMSEMTPKEMKASLELFGLEEYLMLGLFHDLNHFATLYGSCGHIYAVEKLNPLANYFPSLRISMDWPKKAALAIDFIGLIKEFESSKYGYLHHCDIQEANFGITEDSRIKAIDVDLIFTDQRMVGILNQPNCTRDSDCDFFDCVSMCDVKKHQCTSRRITNNLQVNIQCV